MEKLKNDLKTGNFQKIYLFYGEEEYLKKHYMEQCQKKIIPKGQEMMNLSVLEGNQVSGIQIIEAAETLPFLSEKRLVIIKNSELFKSGRADDLQMLVDFFPSCPESSCLLFIEAEVDRRNRGFKSIQKHGYSIEFTHLNEKDLITWVKNRCKKDQKEIDTSTTIYFLRTIGSDMERLSGEIDKLIAYVNTQKQIEKKDIDEICTSSLEVRIFELVKALGNKQAERALEIYSNLIFMKESPHMILAMMARQFRLILQVKYLHDQGYPSNQIARRIGVRDFIVKECLQQGQGFSMSALKEALQDALNADVNMKTGKVDPILGVEMLLIQYAH